MPFPDLVEAPPDAVDVAITWRTASALQDCEQVSDDAVLLSARGRGMVAVRRDPAEILGVLPERSTPAAIVHPLATMPLSVLAYWRGDLTLHGGAFLHNGRAWAVCGPQMAGKSSTLAALGARGVPILADDLVVISGEAVLAGPRCVDLRPDAALRFPASRPLGIVAGRERHRLATPPAPASAPLAGILVLGWGDGAPRLERIPLPEHLRILHEQHYAGWIGPPPPAPLMAALDRPMWHFARGRDWEAHTAALDELLTVLS
ncbi:MAG: hypothetical protein QOI80_3132 [Solirubrobacteraceae bacterium]|jgi:hypothetical protein|nr:hypothetical protein [Solirubrobacteraceae bacterium]